MSDMERDLLERYLSGHTSPQEADRVEAWLAEDPGRWAWVTAAREASASDDLHPRAVRQAKAEVWARIAAHIGEADVLESQPETRARRNSPTIPVRQRVLSHRLAAALVLLTVGGGLAATMLSRWHSSPPALVRVVTTAAGERRELRLPDGTEVVLGVASTLRYPARLATHREIALEGEAYFDVVHDDRRPFVVRAGDLVAKDLGTRFTMRAYPGEPGGRVVVRQGKVAIRALGMGGAELVVAPGQIGRLGTNEVPTVEQADTATWFAWIEGRLVFDNTPLREALPELGRWFGLEFRLADTALGDVPLSGTFKLRPSAEVLDNLAASLGLRQRREGRTVTLYGGTAVR
jgi:transmembrane sensor